MHFLTPNYARVDPIFCGFGTIEFCVGVHANGIYTRCKGGLQPQFQPRKVLEEH